MSAQKDVDRNDDPAGSNGECKGCAFSQPHGCSLASQYAYACHAKSRKNRRQKRDDGKISLHPAAEGIMESFDFEKVKKTIDATGDKWFFGWENRSPTLAEIKCRALNRLELRMQNPSESCGIDDQGMVARIRGGVLSLSYIVESKEATIEEGES